MEANEASHLYSVTATSSYLLEATEKIYNIDTLALMRRQACFT